MIQKSYTIKEGESMNKELIHEIALALNITDKQVETVLSLLESGATVPFIARYRKEMTNGLDEDQIREISHSYEYSVNLLKRKEDVIRLIEEKGLMTDQLKKDIMKATKLSEVEDQYRPFKEKKKTKATMAKAKGLEPLAKAIMAFPRNGSLENMAKKYLNDQVKTIEEALQGASDIIAENIADSAKFRQYTKSMMMKTARIVTKKKKNAEDEKQVYAMYYDYNEMVKYIANHRILAINRAEKQKVISVSFDIDEERFLSYIVKGIIWNHKTIAEDFIKNATKDAFKRLIMPSVEREIRSELTEKAEDASLSLFSENLEHLLLQAPMKDKNVLGLDPGFRTGCKLAVLDRTGKVLHIDKVYISLPKKTTARDEKLLLQLIDQYHIDLIAIGNGTASRESEAYIAKLIQKHHLQVSYAIVSEAGASVYSASKVAQEEFPDYQVEERSAVSIGRRLQDPLAELVKIEPKAISVGQYQHDMNQKKLGESLDFVVEKVVNQVGVNINTASPSLLQYVSGLSKTTAHNIVKYREENGAFTNREQIKKVSKLGPKSYEQSVGFLRILNGNNILDETSIHPDNYKDALALLDYLHLDVTSVGTMTMKEALADFNKEKAMNELGFSHYLMDDLLDAFLAPHRTPRDDYDAPILKSDILDIKDLKVGMKLQGTVRNVVDFGAFVDIGLHEDGLVHISKMSDHKISHPLEVVSVGDIVDVYVYEIDEKRQRVALSMGKI